MECLFIDISDMKPFLKWAGSKYKIIDRITRSLPPGNRLIEPFVGSGSVFLNTDYPEYLVADSNSDLIALYNCIKDKGIDFIAYARNLFIAENNQQESFSRLRTEFNSSEDIARKSAIFIYLNRHCFNGLCRYNSKSQFNVPFGRYKNPTFPETAILDFFHKSQTVEFKVSNFIETMQQAKFGDVVYCDPPYAPLEQTSNFTSYTRGEFTLEHQKVLADIAVKLMDRGISVIISNHDTEFTRSIYNSAQLNFFEVQRFISRNTQSRIKAPELLAIFSNK
jgi:DNA adenine methylase